MEDSLDAALRRKWESEDKAEAAHRQHRERAIECLIDDMTYYCCHAADKDLGKLCADLVNDALGDIVNGTQLVLLRYGSEIAKERVGDVIDERIAAMLRNYLTETDEGQALVNDRVWDMERERDGE